MVTRVAVWLLALAAACGAPRAARAPRPRPDGKNEVIVLGMIHGRHRTAERYGLDEVERLVRALSPDYVLAEIPPDRLPRALDEYRATGKITEPRVLVFPEYTDVIFPLWRELGFELIGCAAWTQELADERSRKLREWKTNRPEDSREVDEGMAWIGREAARRGLADDPRGIHTAAYDAIVERGLEPYQRLFGDDLGAGGWRAINEAHYALIERALDAHRGEGKRFLVTFGAWHKHYFRARLAQRDDVVLRRVFDVVP